jgi:hypothetical protein
MHPTKKMVCNLHNNIIIQQLTVHIPQNFGVYVHYQVLFIIDSPVPKLNDLFKELCQKVADKWENIGLLLDIEEGRLSKVKSDNNNISDNCLREMLKIWTKKVDPKPSWSSMAVLL